MNSVRKKSFVFLNDMVAYIELLELSGKKVITSRNKTGFVGFLINIESLKLIYRDYIQTKCINRLPTLRLSQDFLESFFGRLRSLLGSNNQPTEEQFISAFRKLLVNSELTSSPFSNCIDNLSILSVSSRKSNSTQEIQNTEEEDMHFQNHQQICEQDYLLDVHQHSSIAYLAGTIEGKILKTAFFNCKHCREVFLENEFFADFLLKGKKVKAPCKSTVDICIVASKFIKIYQNQRNFNYNTMVNQILHNIDFDHIYKNSHEHEVGHMFYLVRFIVQEFVRMKFTYIAKNLTLEKQNFLRSKFKNIIKQFSQ